MVAIRAETMRRWPAGACTSTLRMKCTRQRCQVAEITFRTAAFKPSWALEMTSFTPRRPRRVSDDLPIAPAVGALQGTHRKPNTFSSYTTQRDTASHYLH